MTTLYIGGEAGSIEGRRYTLTGERCFTAVYVPRPSYFTAQDTPGLHILLDSGAFSDKPAKRLSFAAALERELEWEARAQRAWDSPDWKVEAFASYDYLLIDEVWEERDGVAARYKKRWERGEAWTAVDVSVRAAEYITSRRDELRPHNLILGCQGTDAAQYVECARGLLDLAEPNDWFGFGGRCILGRHKSLVQEHYETILQVVPLVAARGLKRVHIYGVLYEPALAPLAWLCDQHNITLSTDSARPIVNFTHKGEKARKKAGVRASTFDGQIAWWRSYVDNIHCSKWYRNPAGLLKPKQLSFWSQS